MKQANESNPISDLDLERYVLGELPAAEHAAMKVRIGTDPALARKVREMQSQDQAFTSRFPAETLVPEIQAAARRPIPQPSNRQADLQSDQRQISRRPGARPAWSLPSALAFPWVPRQVWVFALVVLCAVPVVLWKIPADPIGERIKGKAAELRVFRNNPAGPERVANGAYASAGDVFQLEFHPGAFAYGAIVSVDGNGSVTLHWPAHPEDSTAWSRLPEHRLPAAFQLDDSPEFERFHLLLTTAPFNLKAWLARVAESAAHEESWLAAQAPESLTVHTIALKKRP